MSSRAVRAVVVTPFSSEGERVASAIGEGLVRAGIDTVRLDSVPRPPGRLTPSILETIARADLIVVDLSAQNANAYYELGFAHGLRKPTILVTSTDAASNVPSDLYGHLYFVYDRSNLPALSEQVHHAALLYSRTAATA